MSIVRRLLLGEALILAARRRARSESPAPFCTGSSSSTVSARGGWARSGRRCWSCTCRPASLIVGRHRRRAWPPRVRLRLASRGRPALAACAPDGAVARRCRARRTRAVRAATGVLSVIFAVAGPGAAWPWLRDAVGSGRRVLRRWRGAARRRVARGWPAGCARATRGQSPAAAPGPSRGSGFRSAAFRPVAQRAVGGPHRLGGVHHRLGRRVSARGRRADRRSEVRNGRLRAVRGVRAAAAAQSRTSRAVGRRSPSRLRSSRRSALHDSGSAREKTRAV